MMKKLLAVLLLATAALGAMPDSDKSQFERNYITNGSALQNTAGWKTYSDSGSVPVDCTGGSPSSTWTRNTSSPIRYSQDFLWTKSGSTSRQGEGVSYAFTIDRADQAKALSFDWDYEIASGTYVGDSTNGYDMGGYLYDVTNGTLIYPTSCQIENTGVIAHQHCEFQTSYNSTSYRACIHTQSTSTSNYTLQFSGFSITPNTHSTGSITTDWTAYTPVFTGLGTVGDIAVQSRRNGDSLEVKGNFQVGSPTGVTAKMTLGYKGVSGNVTIDSSKLASGGFNELVGYRVSNQALAGSYDVLVNPSTSTTELLWGHHNSSTGGTASQIGTDEFVPNEFVSFYARVPILGWSTSQVLSSDTATNVIAASYFTSGSVALTAGSPIDFATKDFDLGGNVTTGAAWKFTASVPGVYRVSAFLNTTSVSANLNIYKNGALYKLLGTANTSAYSGGSTMIELKGGDYIDVRPSSSGTLATDNTQSISIERLSGPAQIAASETVMAYYGISVDRTPGTSQVNYDTKVIDTHGAVTTGASWKFTAPISGMYKVSGASNVSSGGGGSLMVYKNGSAFGAVSALTTGVVNNTSALAGLVVPMVAGDYIDFRPNIAGSTFQYGFGSPSQINYVVIERVGNY